MTRDEKIAVIRDYVPRLRKRIEGLSDEQLTTAYNAPEWTVAQNVHHLVDSHLNSYMRFKLILTEDHPTLRPYDQERAAMLPDAMEADLTASLQILEGLHTRWARMLEHIADWAKTGYHPELERAISLDDLLTTYANHCEAHIEQIKAVLEKMPDRPRS